MGPKGRQKEGNGLSAERLVLEKGDTDPLSVAPLVSWHSQLDRAPRQRRLIRSEASRRCCICPEEVP